MLNFFIFANKKTVKMIHKYNLYVLVSASINSLERMANMIFIMIANMYIRCVYFPLFCCLFGCVCVCANVKKFEKGTQCHRFAQIPFFADVLEPYEAKTHNAHLFMIVCMCLCVYSTSCRTKIKSFD